MNFRPLRFAPLLPASAALLAACLGDPADLRPVAAPRFAYDSVLTFTVGAFAERAAVSTGGAAISWSVSPALPTGLSLSAAGVITGLPAEADTGRTYIVTAKGPGGSGSDTLRVRVLPETIDPSAPRPEVSMASPADDTVGVAVARAVTSRGGPVTGYAVVPALPPGLGLNILTGAVTGTPAKAYGRAEYAIIAFGPGGRDTATLDLAVHARATADAPRMAVTLRFHAAPPTTALPKRPAPPKSSNTLAKRAASQGNLLPSVTLKRMILVFASNLNDTLRDTVAAGTQGLPLKIDTTRAFAKEYVLPKTLRAWKVTARVFDVRDSLIFADSGAPVAVEGIARDTLDLFSRYTGFRTTYFVPDSLRSASTARAWPITLKRFTLRVDSTVVVDTGAASGFKQALYLEYPYLRPGRSYLIAHVFSGNVATRADTVLYRRVEGHVPVREASTVLLDYVGPTNLQ